MTTLPDVVYRLPPYSAAKSCVPLLESAVRQYAPGATEAGQAAGSKELRNIVPRSPADDRPDPRSHAVFKVSFHEPPSHHNVCPDGRWRYDGRKSACSGHTGADRKRGAGRQGKPERRSSISTYAIRERASLAAIPRCIARWRPAPEPASHRTMQTQTRTPCQAWQPRKSAWRMSWNCGRTSAASISQR